MRLEDTIDIYCASDAASSTMPQHGHPETDGTWGREKMRKGGPDKGGVAAQQVTDPDAQEFIQDTAVLAGGPGSGCKGTNCGRHVGDNLEVPFKKLKTSRVQFGMDEHTVAKYQRKIKLGVHVAAVKVSKNMVIRDGHHRAQAYKNLGMHVPVQIVATSGGQSEGSSLTARKFYVVDGAGRVLHTFMTREEAEQASAANRYSRVVTHVEDATPLQNTPEVRDMARKRLVSPLTTFRRTLPYPGSMGGIYPGSGQSR